MYSLDFDTDKYSVETLPIKGQTITYRAYEWMYNGVTEYKKRTMSQTVDGRPPRNETRGTLTTDQIKTSDALKAMFPAYLNGLELQQAAGTALTLDVKGDGSFKEYVKTFVIASAQNALDGGKDLSALAWITIHGGEVTDIDFGQYVQYATRMKTPSAFDGLDLSTGENDLLGTATIQARHFTQFGLENSTVNGSLADESIVKLMNPMNYIGTEGTTSAQYWRIRHGTLDRDTSLAIPVILATKLENTGFDVDFGMPWDRPHGGDYDLEDLFGWMSRICR